MTITPDQKEGHWHRERSREMEAVVFVQSLPQSGDGCSHPGMPWAAILEVCALVFTVRSCANYVYGVLGERKEQCIPLSGARLKAYNQSHKY